MTTTAKKTQANQGTVPRFFLILPLYSWDYSSSTGRSMREQPFPKGAIQHQRPHRSPSTTTQSWPNPIASGQIGVPGANYDEVFAYPSLNNKGKAVFTAATSHQPLAPDTNCADYCLAMPKEQPLPPETYPFYETGRAEVERPMLADDGTVVARTVSGNRTQIVVYRNGLSAPEAVASTSMGFTELGRSPAISDGGQIVAFYGSLDAASAQVRGMTAGPAIFGALYIDGRWVFGSAPQLVRRPLCEEIGAVRGVTMPTRVRRPTSTNTVLGFSIHCRFDTASAVATHAALRPFQW